MRELLFKNLLSNNKRRKELFMSEHFEGAGMIQEFEKKFVYSIQGIVEYSDKEELEAYINGKLVQDSEPQTHIIRTLDTRARTQKIIYKVSETQYVILKNKVIILKLTQNVKKKIIFKDEEIFLGD